MPRMSTRFHQAATDGHITLLREATSRDSNAPDEDGMTPTLCSAAHGNVEALRMLITRGGNPDKCDIYGNTSLHHAALGGHMGCLAYLVQFGANIWCLDNEFHTAMDLAAMNERMDIVRFLDNVVADQSAKNSKFVRKIKEKQTIEAQKRAKEYARLQARAQKRAEKEERQVGPDNSEVTSHGMYEKQKSKSIFSTLRGLKKESTASQPWTFSEYVDKNSGPSNRRTSQKSKMAPVHKKMSRNFNIGEVGTDGKRSVRSLTGFTKGSEVMYMKNEEAGPSSSSNGGFDRASLAYSEPDMNYRDSGIDTNSDEREQTQSTSIFDRPGLGSISFMNHINTLSTSRHAPEPLDFDEGVVPGSGSDSPTRKTYPHRPSAEDTASIGSAGTLADRMKKHNAVWNAEDVLDDDDSDTEDSSSLELFLAACNLLQVLPLLNKEKIDMAALMLCSDSDLKDIGIPLGPRRLIIDAVERRKEVMEVAGAMTDTKL